MNKKSSIQNLVSRVADRLALRNDSSALLAEEKARPLVIEALEPRILFSGSPAPVPEAVPAEAPAVQEAPDLAEAAPAAEAPAEEATVAAPPEATVPAPEGAADQGDAAVALTDAELSSLTDAAAGIWAGSGISEDQGAALASATYQIADLGGNILGSAEGNVITIDDDGAGRGWFIDDTPQDGSDVATATGVDLLSVLLHEQGHLLGLDGAEGSGDTTNIMNGIFVEGERRLPGVGQADGAVAGSLEGVHYATTVGVDTTAGSNWRTNAQLDIDGNSEYGTDGYIIYGIDEADTVYRNPYTFDKDQENLPTYITSITPPAASPMWSGNGNFGQIQDPDNSNSLTSTPLLANTGDTFTIDRTDGAAFRLTVLVASGDNRNVTFTTSVNDGVNSQTQVGPAHTSNGLHYHVYDIEAGNGDVVVTVDSNPDNYRATGFAFDTAAAATASTPIAVTNPSFESGTTGWTRDGGAYGTRGGVAGITPTDGSVQMWVNEGATIYQQTGETIVAGTEYTFSIDFNPDQVNFGVFPRDVETVFARFYGNANGFGTAFQETQEQGPSGTVTSAENGTQWDTLTVSWTATGAEAGQQLGIAFGVIDNADGIQSEFDNVRVTAETAAAAPPTFVDGTKFGIDYGPTLSDATGNDWNDFAAAGTDNTIHDLDGVVLDGVSITVAGGGYNGAGEDNWVGLSTNGGSAPAEFVDSITTDIGFNVTTTTISGLDTSLTYNIDAVSHGGGAGLDGRQDAITVTGDVGYGTSTVKRGDARTNGTFHNFLGVSPNSSGVITITHSESTANNPVVNGILVEAVAASAGEVTEDASGGATESDSGSFGFDDVAASHTAGASFTSSTHGSRQLGSMTASVSQQTDSGGNGGEVTWNYSVDNDAIQFLAEGETVTEVHTVTVLEGGGAAAPIAGVTYVYEANPPASGRDEDTGGVELTDGNIPPSGGFNHSENVGFLNSEPVIKFDLGANYGVETIDVSYSEGGRWAPSEILVSSSTDGVNFSTPVTIAVGNGSSDQDVANLDVSTVPPGQYYRVEVKRAGQWLFLNEFTFNGAAATGTGITQDVTVTISGSNDMPEITVPSALSGVTYVYDGTGDGSQPQPQGGGDAGNTKLTDGEFAIGGWNDGNHVGFRDDTDDGTAQPQVTFDLGGLQKVTTVDVFANNDFAAIDSVFVSTSTDGTNFSTATEFTLSFVDIDGSAGKLTRASVDVSDQALATHYRLDFRQDTQWAFLNEVTFTTTNDRTETNDPIVVNGSLQFTDVDTTDAVDGAVVGVAVGGTGSGSVPASLTNQALLDMMTLSGTNPVIDGAGNSANVGWTFDSGTEAFDFLAEGDTLELTYTLSATDDSGVGASPAAPDEPDIGTQTVVITITGTSDLVAIEAVDDAYTTDDNTVLNVAAASGLLANDVGAPGDLVTQLGILDLNANGGINPATGAAWAVGDTYRLAFTTSGTTQATSSDINFYNDFVQSAADAAGLGGTWKAIASTEDVDARDNTSTHIAVDGAGEAILLVDGTTVVATDYADFWGNATHNNAINKTENLTTPPSVHQYGDTWTGTHRDGYVAGGNYGTQEANGELGDPDGTAQSGLWPFTSGTHWVWRWENPTTDSLPMYAMSDTLTLTALPDLTVTEVQGGGSLTGTSAQGATVTANADGSFTYDTSTSTTLQALSDGDPALTDTFTYTISDGGGSGGTATSQNVAPLGTAANDGFNSVWGDPTDRINDGLTGWTSTTGFHSDGDADTRIWITWDQAYTIDSVELFHAVENDARFNSADYLIQSLNAGGDPLNDGDWTTVSTVTGNTAYNPTHTFAPVSTEGIRLFITDPGPFTGDDLVRFEELRVFGFETPTGGGGSGATDTATVTITVQGANDAPVVGVTADTELTETTDTSDITGGITVNFEDVDLTDTGHSASITGAAATGAVAGLALDQAGLMGLIGVNSTTKASGSNTGSSDLTFTAASTDFDYLPVGATVTITYTIVVDDGDATGSGTFDVVITGTNDNPTAVDDEAATAEDQAVVIKVGFDALTVPSGATTVLANDTDIDGVRTLETELGILDLNANGGINPNTGVAWATGDQYRLAFVTSQFAPPPTSTDIATYNAWVQGQAAAAGLGAATWNVIGSTETVHAHDNTGTNPATDGSGVAIFKVDGSSVIANDYNDLWDSDIDTPIDLDEFGNAARDDGAWGSHGGTWTGSDADGTSDTGGGGSELGSGGSVRIGINGWANAWWMDRSSAADTETNYVMYAMSDLLTVTASEPDNSHLFVSDFDAESAKGGIVTMDSNGEFTYDPNGKFNSLVTGETDTDTFTYTLDDGDGGASTGTVTVTINGASITIVDRVLTIGEESGRDDRVTISSDGTNLRIHDAAGTVVAGAGGTQVDANTVEILLSTFDDIVFEAKDSNDIVTIGNMAGFTGSLTVLGGDGFDEILLANGASVSLGADEDLLVDGETFKADLDSSVSVLGDGTIDILAAGGSGDFAGLNLRRASLSSEGGGITLTGVGGDTGNTNDGVVLTHGSTVSTGGGSVTITGTATSTTGANDGISLKGGSDITAGGAGGITLTGTSGGVNSSYGVQLFSGTEVTTAGGDIAIVGSSDAVGSRNAGIYINGATVTAGGAGSVAMTGTGGGAGSNNNGLSLAATAVDAGTSGDVTLVGLGGGGTSGNGGVQVGTRTSVSAGGGNVTITGTGGAGTGVRNTGVSLLSGSSVSSGGDTEITGVAGTGTSRNGGVVLTSATVAATGDLTVDGTGNGTGSNNSGISSSRSTLGGAEVTLAGTGSTSSTAGRFNDGVSISRGGVTASGTLTIDAAGGTGSRDNRGLMVSRAALGGTLAVTGSADPGSGSRSTGVFIQNSVLSDDGTIAGTGGGVDGVDGFGVYMRNITGGANLGVTTTPDTDEEKGGNFFEAVLPAFLLLGAGGRTKARRRAVGASVLDDELQGRIGAAWGGIRGEARTADALRTQSRLGASLLG